MTGVATTLAAVVYVVLACGIVWVLACEFPPLLRRGGKQAARSRRRGRRLGPIEAKAFLLLAERRRRGVATYGQGLEDCGKSVEELLADAIEEAADLLLYLLAMRRLIRKQRGGTDR